MKNTKSVKSILTIIMMICVALAALWMIIDMTGEVTSWWFDSQDGKLSLDWKYAGPYMTLMIIALGTWLTRTIMFTCKLDPKKGACPTILCEGLIGLGIIMALIALFLPVGIPGSPEEIWPYQLYDNTRMIAAVIISWIGMPMALVSGIASIWLDAHK